MKEIVVVGGYGSSPKQYQSLADELQQKYGPDLAISGVNFFAAIQNPEALADKIHRQAVTTHSGGACAVARAVQLGAVPEQLNMIAPPVYDSPYALALHGLNYDMRQRRKRREQSQTIEDIALKEGSEILRHPRFHIGTIAELGRFPTLNFAAACARLDVSTKVGLMDEDGLFRIGRYPREEFENASENGVGIRLIRGDHTRFTREPSEVLNELDVAVDISPQEYAQLNNPRITSLDLGKAATALSNLLVPARHLA